MLAGIIEDGQLDLGGSAFGYFPATTGPILGRELAPGDEIVLIESAGIHTNGNTLARRAAQLIGWDHRLSDGTSLADAVLAPSIIYVQLLRALIDAQLPLHYASHITGHGLRKLMRADRQLSYRLTALQRPQPVFTTIIDALDLDAETAYGTFNMGSGFALMSAPGTGNQIVEAASTVGLEAIVAGVVEAGPRRVILEEVGVTFTDEDLQLR